MPGSASLAELHDRLADPDLGPELERGGLRDATGADVGAVGRAEVLDVPLVARAGDAGVAGGDVVVVEADRGVVPAADQERGLVERHGLALVAALDDDHLGGSTAAGLAGLRGRLLPVAGALVLPGLAPVGRLPRHAGSEHVGADDGDAR